MNTLKFNFVFVLVCWTAAHGSSLSVDDQLMQVEQAGESKFLPIRKAKLELTPFDCGRVIIQPAFTGEYSVSVYSRPGTPSRRAYVTLISCDKSLWQTTDIGQRPRDANSVKTRRIDCDIPLGTAERLKTVWAQMLSGRNGPRPFAVNDIFSTDGTEAEFSIQLPSQTAISGMILDVTVVGRNAITGTLVAISNDLIAYCQTKPSERPRILNRIDRRTSILLDKIRKRDGG